MIGIDEALYKACEDNRKLEDEIEQKDKEIERLNNRVKQLEKSIMISNKKHSFMTKDNIKLRTIINELEKESYLGMMENQNNNDYAKGLYTAYKYINDKLQELKGSE